MTYSIHEMIEKTTVPNPWSLRILTTLWILLTGIGFWMVMEYQVRPGPMAIPEHNAVPCIETLPHGILLHSCILNAHAHGPHWKRWRSFNANWETD